jgi:hypothetical protein
MLPTSSEEESSTLEASNVHNSPEIEKENETNVEHSANVVSDDSIGRYVMKKQKFHTIRKWSKV